MWRGITLAFILVSIALLPAGTALAGGAPPGEPVDPDDPVAVYLAGTHLVDAVRDPATGYRLESRALPGAAYRAELAPAIRERLARHLAAEAVPFGITRAVIVMLAAIGDEPAYLAPLYPQFRTQGGLSEITADLAPVGLPGFRPLARFMYHRHGQTLILYFLPRQVPEDEAIAERVMSDVLSSLLLDAHVRLGALLAFGTPSQNPDEYRALQREQPVTFRRAPS